MVDASLAEPAPAALPATLLRPIAPALPTPIAAPAEPLDARAAWPAAYAFETPRVLLRAFEPRDAIGAAAALDEHRATLGPWLDLDDDPADVDIMVARLAGFRAAFDRGERFHYAAFVAGYPHLIGTIAVEPIGGRGILVGGWLVPSLAHHGIASEALDGACALAFTLGSARYAEARVRVDNAASRALVARTGFVHEATLAGRCWSRGVAHDEEIWTRPRATPSAAPRAYDVLGRALI